jgi:hypothetical protein
MPILDDHFLIIDILLTSKVLQSKVVAVIIFLSNDYNQFNLNLLHPRVV